MRINDKENYIKIRNNISMTNLGKIINSKGFTITKVAINSKLADSTVMSYINGQKIPSLPTLISLADYLGTNIDFLLDRTTSPTPISEMENIEKDKELSLLFHEIKNLPLAKRQLIIGYVKGLNDSK